MREVATQCGEESPTDVDTLSLEGVKRPEHETRGGRPDDDAVVFFGATPQIRWGLGSSSEPETGLGSDPDRQKTHQLYRS